VTEPWATVAEVAVGASLLGLTGWALQTSDAPLQWRTLRFPQELRVEQVEALLSQVAAGRGPVVFVLVARPEQIGFRLGASKTVLMGLTAALAGIAPEVRVDPADAHTTTPLTLGVRAAWPGRWPLLRTDATEMAVAGLLGSLSTLSGDEELRVMIRLTPVRRRPRIERDSPIDAERHLQTQLRRKFAGPLLRTEVLLTVSAQPAARATQLAQGVLAALRVLNGPRGQMRARRLRALAATSAAARLTGQDYGWRLTPRTLLSPAELVGVVGLPVANPKVAGIAYGTAPRLMPPRELPDRMDAQTRVFAVSTWPGQADRRLAQPLVGGLQHTAVIGPTGSGKSALIARLVEQDLAANRGALVVDIKGDLVDDLLARIPERRRGDVILCDPASGGPQPGLNLFPAGGDPELTADLLLGTLAEIYRDSWGIRTSSYLRLGLVTLAQCPGASLPLLPALFTDRSYRARVLAGVKDRLLLAAWQRFEALSSADQATQLAPALRKLEELTGRARLRAVLGQSSPRLHFGEVMARGRIVLVRLPPGLLGAPAARLLSSLVLWQFAQAVEARAAVPAAKRHPFMAYVDEVAALGALPLPLDSLLERARGHGVGLTLAPQSLGQLGPALRSALLANVGSLITFRPSADEARVLARELPEVSAEQLQHLERFEVALRLSLGPGHTTPTMTGRTLPLGDTCGDPAAIRQLSATRWGASLDDVDAALAKHLGLTKTPDRVPGRPPSDPDVAPIGSRRRAS
jgi:hypothetical protein